MKLRSVTYALLIAGVATFSTSSLAAQSLRFGYETSQTDSQHIAAKKFNELLQEKTKGELKLKLFPDSTLGNAQAMISGVRGGTIDMEMSGSNNFTGLSPVINLLDVPFLFRDTALLIAGVATFSTSSLAAQSLRFGYETSQTDSQHIAAKKFNELLQEKTKGELKLKLFPDSTLGNAQAMISGVRGGTIDMEMSGSNNFTGLSPVINLLDVPFLFRDTAHAHKTLDGKVGDDLKVSLEGKGLKVLAYWENGWRDVTNSRAPVKTPADLKGLKIRTNNSPMNIAAFKVFGANPIPMPFAEVYTGLETRTIDAQEHPINVVWSAKFYEVQKYLSLTHHAYSPLLVVINKAKFDGLTPEFQQALISSAQEAGSYQRKLVAEDQQKIIDGMKEAGVEVITDLDRKAFSDALGTQVRDMFVKDVPQGADLLKAVDEVQ